MYVPSSMSTRLARAARFAALIAPVLLAAVACGPLFEDRGPAVERPRFDGAAALALVERQVAFGPRVPGEPGHTAQLGWMRARLDSLADEVVVDSFTAVDSSGDTLRLANVIARFRPDAPRRILLLAHWDTRPVSDGAIDPSLRDVPVPGANDGGSGTAVLLQLASLFGEQPPPVGVDLLFVDGEDYGATSEDMFFGSRHYAANLPGRGEPGRPVYGVLLDMVGARDARFHVEATSAEFAAPVVSKVWGTARRLGYEEDFPRGVGERLGDDHVPLIEAGLPTIDVIDFPYGPDNAWWHTPEDTPDKLSAATLEKVGETIAELVYTGG